MNINKKIQILEYCIYKKLIELFLLYTAEPR